MKLEFRVRQGGSLLLNQVYDVGDADSFGRACADVWVQLERRNLARSGNVGEIMERTSEGLGSVLDGAEIALAKV